MLGRMFHGIQFRGFSQKVVEDLAKYAGVPVWNGLTDAYHPTQILADFLTLQENFGDLRKVKLVYTGDGRNNMGNSLMIGAAKVGMHFVITAPESLFPEKALIDECREIAKGDWSGILEFEVDPFKAVKDASAIYTDVWASMGEEDKIAERKALLGNYQVNAKLMESTGRKDSIFLHCLPAVKGNEVTEDVFRIHPVHGFRRGRKPAPHHQGRHGGHRREYLGATLTRDFLVCSEFSQLTEKGRNKRADPLRGQLSCYLFVQSKPLLCARVSSAREERETSAAVQDASKSSFEGRYPLRLL